MSIFLISKLSQFLTVYLVVLQVPSPVISQDYTVCEICPYFSSLTRPLVQGLKSLKTSKSEATPKRERKCPEHCFDFGIMLTCLCYRELPKQELNNPLREFLNYNRGKTNRPVIQKPCAVVKTDTSSEKTGSANGLLKDLLEDLKKMG